jgi:hypothetical protein
MPVPVAIGLTADNRARRRRRQQGSKNEHHTEQGLREPPDVARF